MVGEKKIVLEDRVIVPLLPLLDSKNNVDKKSLKKLCAHIKEAGINTVLALGQTGGLEYVSDSERRKIAHAIRQNFPGRMILCVGDRAEASHEGVKKVRDNIKLAARLEADAVALTTLFYDNDIFHDTDFNGEPADRVLVEPYFRVAVEEAKDNMLPVFFYNNPSMMGNEIPTTFVEALAGDEMVLGIKDSSGDPFYFEGLLSIAEANPSFRVYQGCEELIGMSIEQGAFGIVPSLANIFPKLMVRALEDPGLQEIVNDIGSAVYGGGSSARRINGLKYALFCMGILGDGKDSDEFGLNPDTKKAIEAVVRSHRNAYS